MGTGPRRRARAGLAAEALGSHVLARHGLDDDRLAAKIRYVACGVPVELVHPSEGTGQREAWRRFLHGTVQPLGRIVAGELSRVLGSTVRITFEGLFASDIAGRARAFQSMVGAGLDIEEAARQSGLVAVEE